MQKTIINVPEGITKLSQWTEFGNYLPGGKIILNKKITGCGATTYFLENNTPVILCSHRTELLESKARSKRHIGKVHLFKTSADTSSKDLVENMKNLHSYLDSCILNPFTGSYITPKILVTTDSLGHVLTVLQERGILDKFSVVSDEMQCIFTDAAFKGGSVLSYLSNLQYVKNVIFLSATPYLEEYLDRLPEFRDLLYIELEWPESTVEEVFLDAYYIDNLRLAAISKINFYKENGYFEENSFYKATQAVFFINSITEILSIIKSCKLTPDEVNIICSKTNKKTKFKLKRAGLEVGFAPDYGQPHKTYTFVTKCAYEGVDFYHSDAYTYIFSNPNLSNMAMDLSIDIIQILGRQRREDNPWKTKATIYYQTTKDKFKIPKEEFLKHQAAKDANTVLAINTINSTPKEQKGYIIRKFDHGEDGYIDDYVEVYTDPITGEVIPIANPLIRIAEERAYDIRNELYDNKYQVLRGLSSLATIDQSKIQEINQYFSDNKEFTKRMCFYCMFLTQRPDLYLEVQGSVIIPVRYHRYFNELGPDRIKSLSYQESNIIDYINSGKTIQDNKSVICSSFTVGSSYFKKDIKTILQNIYDMNGINKTAKATDILEYFNITDVNLINSEGKRIKGYQLLSIK